MGGPETLDDVKPFLYNLFADPDIIRLPPALKVLQDPLVGMGAVCKQARPRLESPWFQKFNLIERAACSCSFSLKAAGWLLSLHPYTLAMLLSTSRAPKVRAGFGLGGFGLGGRCRGQNATSHTTHFNSYGNQV